MRFPPKTTLAVLAFGVMILFPYVLPVFRDYKPFDPASASSVFDFPLRNAAEEQEAGPLASPEAIAEMKAKRLTVAATKNLVDPDHALDHFYDALLKNDVTRILHYGDSPTTADLITADARALFQKDFGNSGIGFVLIARPWAWYNRRGIDMEASNWKIDIGGNSELKDGLNGLGAVSFQGQPGATAKWHLRDPAHRTVEFYFLYEPVGGEFQVKAEVDGDDLVIGTASTAAEKRRPGFVTFGIPEGASTLMLNVTSGSVRLYGADFRRPGRGVVYSSIGVNGANVTLLSHAYNPEHWAEEMRHYKPDLVIINYGTNESGFPDFVDTTWGKELRSAVRRVQAAVPDASILLMSPMDRGERTADGDIDTLASIPRLVNTESKIALETHVAFFNTFQAMGGQGTMGRWYNSEPRLVGADYIHPMPAGAKIVGELLYSALRDGLNHYKMQSLRQKIAAVSAKQVPPGQRP